MKGLVIALLLISQGALAADADDTERLFELLEKNSTTSDLPQEEIDWNPAKAGLKGSQKMKGWINVKGRKYQFLFFTDSGTIPLDKVCKPVQNTDYTDCLIATKVAFAYGCIERNEPMYCEAFKKLDTKF